MANENPQKGRKEEHFFSPQNSYSYKESDQRAGLLWWLEWIMGNLKEPGFEIRKPNLGCNSTTL